MELKIVHGKPPHFDRMLKAFPKASDPRVVFTYGDTVYVPSGAQLSPWLRAHEEIHAERQIASGDIDLWVDRYIEDLAFRFEEEKLAHIAECDAIRLVVRQRSHRRILINHAAARLSGPLYGHMISAGGARNLLRARQALR